MEHFVPAKLTLYFPDPALLGQCCHVPPDLKLATTAALVTCWSNAPPAQTLTAFFFFTATVGLNNLHISAVSHCEFFFLRDGVWLTRTPTHRLSSLADAQLLYVGTADQGTSVLVVCQRCVFLAPQTARR